MRILYVDDDPEAREFVRGALARKGFEIDLEPSGAGALSRALQRRYDAVVLDVMLDGESGFALLERLRKAGCEAPVLFLSALGDVASRVQGLESGADDYLPKPFALAELAARLRVLGRRHRVPRSERIEIDDLVIDPAAHRVERAGRSVRLTPKEFSMLEFLAENAGSAVSRAMIVERVWGASFAAHDNVIEVHVNRLRAKLEADSGRRLLHTVRGFGYVLDDRRGRRDSGEAET